MWANQERARLDELLDQIIPPSADGSVPGAGQIGVGEYLSRVAETDADLAIFVRDALAFETDRDPHAAVVQLEGSDPAGFGAMLRHIYMGYYSRPDVRALFGLSPAPVHPKGYDVPVEPAELLAALTASVAARGPCYRAASPSEGQR